MTTDLISQCLYTEGCAEPDMIIRISGETRLSDFLLWQASSSFICFTDVLWPDLSYSRFAWLIIKYQISHKRLQEDRAELEKKQLEWQTE